MKRTKASIIYQNDHIGIVHDACKLCYNGNPEDTIEGKLKYIENKVKLGHESVLEHSNIVILVEDSSNNYQDYIEVLECSKYLNSRTKQSKNGISYHLLGGNIRAFKNIFRNIMNDNNTIAKVILESLYDLPKEYMYDFIEAGLMNPIRFRFDEVIYEDSVYNNIITSNNMSFYEITNMDKIHSILLLINIYVEDLFTYDDILDMCSVTVFFNNISRIITQQITRHRNGISQKSQRYVDEGQAKGNNPLTFSNKLPVDTTFTLKGFPYRGGTLDDISEGLISIYTDLREQGLTKEDARYYLPQNTQSSLYMTFTFRSLLHFLSVRMENAAQAEIRNIARDILYHIEPEVKDYLGEDLFKYIAPKYILAEVDYDLSILEEAIED